MRPHSLGQGEAIRETDAAVLVMVEDLDEEVWIPKSQIHDDSEVWEDGHVGEVVVSEWLAGKQGWT